MYASFVIVPSGQDYVEVSGSFSHCLKSIVTELIIPDVSGDMYGHSVRLDSVGLTGFTVDFTSSIDSTGYKLAWMADEDALDLSCLV